VELKLQLLQTHPFWDRAVFNQVQHLEKREPPSARGEASPPPTDSKAEAELSVPKEERSLHVFALPRAAAASAAPAALPEKLPAPT